MIIFLFACRLDNSSTVETSLQEDSSPSIIEPSEDTTEEPQDIDSDGFDTQEDCDDWDPAIHPDAEEVFDHIDNNCDGIIDFDGVFSGSMSMNATAIYEGNPYSFVQSCVGDISRERGAAQLQITCPIDLQQQHADLLLGETLSLQASSTALHDQSWTTSIEIVSSNGWDSNGEIAMQWSDLLQDLGSQIDAEVTFSSVSLNLFIEGTLQRE